MLTPGVTTEQMVELVREGLDAYGPDAAVYIRPMYWGIDGDATAIVPQENSTGFAICLEEIPMAPETASATLGLDELPARKHLQDLDRVVRGNAGTGSAVS